MSFFKKTDFWVHAFLCFIIAAVVSGIMANITPDMPLPAILSGFFAATLCGFGKEYGDSQAVGNKWSWSDIVADVFGASVGSQVGWAALLINMTV